MQHTNVDVDYTNDRRNDKCYLNEGEEDEMEVVGYCIHKPYQICATLVTILTLGFLKLVFLWFPRIQLALTYKKCALAKATKLLIVDRYENYVTFMIENVILGKISSSSNLGFVNKTFESKTISDTNFDFTSRFDPLYIHLNNGGIKVENQYRLVIVKKLRYIWDEEKNQFIKMTGLGNSLSKAGIHNYSFVDSDLRTTLCGLYGKNEIQTQVQSYATLFFIEIISPYYFFQFFSIAIWILDAYYYFTGAIVFISAISILITIIQTHAAQKSLQKRVRASESTWVELMGPDKTVVRSSSHILVPGDRIIIPDRQEYTVPCDAVILSGSCIVSESMLTGESVPLTKTALPDNDEKFLAKENATHMLFGGTKVIQTRRQGGQPVFAIVLRTGYVTAKGELVRAILYPPPVDYRFEQSVYKFINMTAALGLVISCVVAVWAVWQKWKPLQVFIKSFEIVTMMIPAAIPGSLTLSRLYALQRFRRNGLSCTNPKVINVAGSANCVCFDKTGTLTEDGLDVLGVLPVSEAAFKELNMDPSYLENNEAFKHALAVCHSLSHNNDNIVGDPLDKKMFESTGWIFEDSSSIPEESNDSYPLMYPNNNEKLKYGLKIVHQNQFISNLQRMSVVVERLNSPGYLYLYCKGSPEMMVSLSTSSSVPFDFDEVLDDYTKMGYRVLALGCRKLEGQTLDEIKKASRSEVERGLEFLGLLIMENKVKEASLPAINLLKKGKFKITMITGDNIQTAISVSRECKIIEDSEQLMEIGVEDDNKLICYVSQQTLDFNINSDFEQWNVAMLEEGRKSKGYKLAMTGNVWEVVKSNYDQYLDHILVRTAIFARMSSKQKQQVVTELQAIGYSVVMCGDGANDCAALKAAHIGVSLSQTEASMASALSSAKEDISCVPTVIREGRASLIASFGLIKFILSYGYIQIISTLISYSYFSDLSDFEYIWQDMFLIILFSTFFGLTQAYQGDIVPETPINIMVHTIPILSLSFHTIIFLAFELIADFWIQKFSWFTSGPVNNGLKDPHEYMITYSYRNYSVFTMSVFQIIISGIIFSKGYPYRKPIYTNYLYLFSILFAIAVTVSVTIYPANRWIQELFVLAMPPMEFRYLILCIVAVNLVISFVVETIVIEYLMVKKLKKLSYFNRQSKTRYETASELTYNSCWLSSIVQAYSFVDHRQKISITDFSAAFNDI